MGTHLTCHYHFEKQDSKLPFCIVAIDDGMDLGLAQDFGALIMQKYSGARLYLVSHTTGNDIDNGVETNEKYTAIGLYAEIYLKSTDGKRRWVKIPAPLNITMDANQRVPLALGQEVAAEYSRLTGKTYQFAHGALTGKSNPIL
jgi:hypothetical protein